MFSNGLINYEVFKCFCQFFVIVLKIICSLIRIQALFDNCTIFCRCLEAIYIALGHVNPIGNYSGCQRSVSQ